MTITLAKYESFALKSKFTNFISKNVQHKNGSDSVHDQNSQAVSVTYVDKFFKDTGKGASGLQNCQLKIGAIVTGEHVISATIFIVRPCSQED